MPSNEWCDSSQRDLTDQQLAIRDRDQSQMPSPCLANLNGPGRWDDHRQSCTIVTLQNIWSPANQNRPHNSVSSSGSRWKARNATILYKGEVLEVSWCQELPWGSCAHLRKKTLATPSPGRRSPYPADLNSLFGKSDEENGFSRVSTGKLLTAHHQRK